MISFAELGIHLILMIQKSDGVSVDNNQTQVSIENLNAGLYFILIESKNSKSYKRLIKQ